MKVIFIDIDGVFFPQRASFLPGQDVASPKLMPPGEGDPSWPEDYRGRRWKPVARKLDPVAVSLLARLIELSGARVVASTSWRYHPGAGKEAIEQAFQEAGFNIAETWHEDWATQRTMSDDRVREVGEWLDEHRDLERWVAFEDAHRLQTPGTIYVDSVEGLSFANYRAALLLLNVQDEAFGPGGGWPRWTEWGEREAITQWLDYAYGARHRRWVARRDAKPWEERARGWEACTEEVDGYADQIADDALKAEDPWTAEGGPQRFLRDPESIEERIAELRDKDREQDEALAILGYPGVAKQRRRRPGTS